MTSLLLDTHAWVWTQFLPSRMTPVARKLIQTSDDVFVSAASVYEIAQKVRRDRWPGMDRERLGYLMDESEGVVILPIGADEASIAGLTDWSHRDPFDRLIAATALTYQLTLVSTDPVFDDLTEIERVWR